MHNNIRRLFRSAYKYMWPIDDIFTNVRHFSVASFSESRERISKTDTKVKLSCLAALQENSHVIENKHYAANRLTVFTYTFLLPW